MQFRESSCCRLDTLHPISDTVTHVRLGAAARGQDLAASIPIASMLREHRWVQAAVLSSQVEENSAYSWMAHPPATESHLPPPAGHPRVVCGSRPSFGSSEHLRGAPAMQATYLSPISATRSHRLRTASSWILLISLSPTHMRGTDIVSYDSFRHPVVLLPSAAPCGIWFKLQDFAIHGVDADFLPYDDDGDFDEAIDLDDDEGEPNPDEFQSHDALSGWSSRTKGVARYLKTLFDEESGRGRKNVVIDHLVNGKSRKEASRMFFETLVLSTKDYIQVEQPIPFGLINVKPVSKLLKTDF
ncbi:uncharacterized protein LOC125538402 isoform X1 [Triticum urartu]|uniref:Rad21/Rec8-like protein C-terminal eukaryotic domain-containing protein n=1 Tax=Triticum urartu TaxID=4572 RepID=A0A8R7PFV5_TRIUA|nr:uncharacterized protein LOC125538402 isoform X1 [Triticum urartu]